MDANWTVNTARAPQGFFSEMQDLNGEYQPLPGDESTPESSTNKVRMVSGIGLAGLALLALIALMAILSLKWLISLFSASYSSLDSEPTAPVDSLLVDKFAKMNTFGSSTIFLRGAEWSSSPRCMAVSPGAKVLATLRNPARPREFNGLLILDPDGVTAVFAVLGSGSARDWAYDLASIIPQPFIGRYFPDAPFGSFVGFGFWEYFVHGVEDIQKHIDTTLAENPQIKNVIFTGRSLGGALTTLNVGHFYPQLVAQGYNVTSYSLASPRTVNGVFAAYLDKLPAFQDGTYFRVLKSTDIIAQVPPRVPLGFSHVGTEYLVDSSAPEDDGKGWGAVHRYASPAPGVESPRGQNARSLFAMTYRPGHETYFGYATADDGYGRRKKREGN